jgi:uncharacterized protein (TIGR02444 family)
MSGETGTISLDGPHWTFALEFYAKPDVAPACLTLQDKAGVDVILLLYALFVLQREGIALATPQIAELDGAITGWRKDVVIPLRILRRRIKQGFAPLGKTTADPLLQQVAQAAISSEQVALAVLASRPLASSGDEQPEASALIERVIRFYAPSSGSASGGNDPAVTEAARTIADAASFVVRD